MAAGGIVSFRNIPHLGVWCVECFANINVCYLRAPLQQMGMKAGSSNGFAAPAPAAKPGLDGIDAFVIQGFKKEQDGGGILGGGVGGLGNGQQLQQQQQQQQQQPVYNNIPLNQIPAKGEREGVTAPSGGLGTVGGVDVETLYNGPYLAGRNGCTFSCRRSLVSGTKLLGFWPPRRDCRPSSLP